MKTTKQLRDKSKNAIKAFGTVPSINNQKDLVSEYDTISACWSREDTEELAIQLQQHLKDKSVNLFRITVWRNSKNTTVTSKFNPKMDEEQENEQEIENE